MKKLFIIFVILALVLASPLSVFAAETPYKPDKLPVLEVDCLFDNNSFEVIPGEKLNLPFKVTARNIPGELKEAYNIEISIEKGEDIIAKIEADKIGDATLPYVSVIFSSALVSTRSAEFELKISFTGEGKGFASRDITVRGEAANPLIYVDSGTTYVDISDGSVAYSGEYIKDVEVSIGEGISINTSFFPEYKYYGTVSAELSGEDYLLMCDYPEIEKVYSISTINLRKDDTKNVRFSFPYETYYVYNSDFEYIGTTSIKLPYSGKYYLCTKKIEKL